MVQIFFWLLSFTVIFFMGLLGFRSFVGNASAGKHTIYASNVNLKNLLMQLTQRDALNKLVVYGGALTLLLLNLLLVLGIIFFPSH